MTRADVLAALMVLERRGARRDVDFASHLFGPQRAYFEDPGRIKVVRAGRRGGKSTGFAARLLKQIHNRPGKNALYLTLTRKNAKRILWPAARAVLEAHQIPYTMNLTDLEIRLRGGGTLLIGGVDTQDQVDRYRGLAYAEAVVDECQSFPHDRLRALHQDVLRPAMMDYGGALTFGGTPGWVPAGHWYDLSGPDSPVTVHHWTALDNPHIPNVIEELERIRRENGWTEQSPTYQREYMGIWVLDDEAIVYPFSEARNGIAALPRLTDSGAPVDPAKWRHVLSVDVGEVHATAFVVVSAHPALSEDYIQHSEKMLDMRTDRMAARIQDLHKAFPGPIVMDTQGIGRKHADEVRSRYGLPVEAAEKADKPSAIRITRDRLLAGQLKVVMSPKTEPLRAEWQTIVWNKERNDHLRDQEDHCADACLYAVRRLRNYTGSHLRPSAKEGTAEWFREQEELMIKRLERRLRRERRPAWER